MNTELAWMGGFFDAEGSITTHNNAHTPWPRLMADMGNNDVRALEPFIEQFGLRIANTGRRCLRAYGNASQTEALLRAILPYTVIKRERIETCLQYRELTSTTGIRYPPEIKARRLALLDQLKWMNTKGLAASYVVDTAERFPDEILWPYLAGFTDGDGYIGVNKQRDLRVGLYNTHPAPLRWVAEMYDMKLGSKEQPTVAARTIYSVHLSGVKAREFIVALYPYLRSKKELAEHLLRQ